MKRYYVITSLGIICIVIFQWLYIDNLYTNFKEGEVVQIEKTINIAFHQELRERTAHLFEGRK